MNIFRGLLKSVFVLLFLFVSANILAEMYFLNDLINQGLKNSTSMIRVQNSMMDRNETHLSNYLDFLPNASYTANYIDPNSLTDYNSSFSISKFISLNEPTYFNFRRSLLEKEITRLSYENRKKEIARDILFSYINIIQLEQSIFTTEVSLNQQKRMYDLLRIQFESGNRTVFDIQNLELDILDTHIQLIELNNSLTTQRENLFFMIKMEDKGYPFELFDFVISDTYDELEQTNINIEMAELGIRVSKSSLTQQHLSLFPSLSAGYSWSTGIHNSSSGYYDWNNGVGVFSINVSYSLFNHRSQIGYRIAKRSFNLEKIILDDEKEKYSIEVLQIINDLNRLKQTYELNQQRLELSKLNLQMAEERYILGVLSNIELIEIRNRHLNTEHQVINQFYSIIRKQEELNFAKSGKILGIW